LIPWLILISNFLNVYSFHLNVFDSHEYVVLFDDHILIIVDWKIFSFLNDDDVKIEEMVLKKSLLFEMGLVMLRMSFVRHV
jgi:hypothetical protein